MGREVLEVKSKLVAGARTLAGSYRQASFQIKEREISNYGKGSEEYYTIYAPCLTPLYSERLRKPPHFNK